MENEKALQKLEDLYYILGDYLRVKIVERLYSNDENESKSFSEIHNFLEKVFEKEYPSSLVLFHLKGLEKRGIIRNERRLDLSTGRARTSFYRLTEKGKGMAEIIMKVKEIIESGLKEIP